MKRLQSTPIDIHSQLPVKDFLALYYAYLIQIKPDQATFVFIKRSYMIKFFHFVLLQGHYFLYFHLDKGHCLAETGRSPANLDVQ